MKRFERRESVEEEDLRKKAVAKAREALQTDSVDLENFVDLYDREKIEKDIEYVERMKKKFEEDSTPESEKINDWATVFEAIFHNRAELSNWLGPEAHTIRPSDYDDIKNGVDSVVEFRREEGAASHLALAIDVTFSSRTSSVLDKLEKIRDEIEAGDLAQIKYFVSDHMGIRGELNGVPRVVIGSELSTVKDVAEKWIVKDKRSELAKHPIQFQILDEIESQLRAFAQYAISNDRPQIAKKYFEALKIIERVLDNKQELRRELGPEVENSERADALFNAIIKFDEELNE